MTYAEGHFWRSYDLTPKRRNDLKDIWRCNELIHNFWRSKLLRRTLEEK